MYAVITNARLTPGRIDDVREAFRRANAGLIADEPDWVSTIFTANRGDDTVTMVARWRNADSYRAFAASDKYRQAMAELALYFRGPPAVQINEILVEV